MISYHVDRNPADGVVSLTRMANGTTTPIGPEFSRETINHSPTGFEMGYRGSGPSQLALAIVLDYLVARSERESPPPSLFRVKMRARTVYQKFLGDFIAGPKELLRVDQERLEEWLAGEVPRLSERDRTWWEAEPGEPAAAPGPADQYVIETEDALRKGGQLDPRVPPGDR